MANDSLLEVEDLCKYYISGYVFTEEVVGAEDVTFSLDKGEILALVGESGSGKSTVSNIILRLMKPSSGTVKFKGRDITEIDKIEYWNNVQTVFQDPYSTFNKYYQVDKVLHDAFDLKEKMEGVSYSEAERSEIIEETLAKTGVNADEILGRYPHQTSGGQMQRLLVVRSLIIEPELLVADEPTSMIDASTRVGVLNELNRLREEGMSIMFITHDVGQAYYIADRAAVMKDGKIVEMGPAEKVFFEPEHPYTQNLIDSVPKLHEKWDL